MPKEFRTQLRLPHKLSEAIKRIAEIEKRSFHAQVLIYLEKGLPDGLLDATKADLIPAVTGVGYDDEDE